MSGSISLMIGMALSVAPMAGTASPAPGRPALPSDIVDRSTQKSEFPTFCRIPLAPTDMRTPTSFKASVVAVRLAGAAVVSATAPGSFGLNDTETFAENAKTRATPPPPEQPVAELDTDAFVRDALKRATTRGRR
jgi:hypothetical protein